MPSPFPGMDPYLEDPVVWPDFHGRFLTFLCDAIGERLPTGYDARLNERVYLSDPEEVPPVRRQIGPDVAVEHMAGRPAVGAASTAPVGVLDMIEPAVVPLATLDPVKEAFIEVVTYPDRELITVIELLSPTNKSGRGRVEYLDKRDELIKSDVHLVELDLLLGGQRVPMRKPLPPGDYYALVARADRRPNCDVYAWSVRRVLPSIPIPLRPQDGDVQADLRAVFNETYNRGRYARVLPYDRPPVIRLPEEDVAWAADQVKGMKN